MEIHGWTTNFIGFDITVYGGSKNWTQQGSPIGKLLKSECFAEGTAFGAG